MPSNWGNSLISGIGAGEQLAAPFTEAIEFNKNKDLQQQQIDNEKVYRQNMLALQAKQLQQQNTQFQQTQNANTAKIMSTDASGQMDQNAYLQTLSQLNNQGNMQALAAQASQMQQTQNALKNTDVTYKDPSSGATYKTTADQAAILMQNPQIASQMGISNGASATSGHQFLSQGQAPSPNPQSPQGLQASLGGSQQAPAAPSTQASGAQEAPAPVATNDNSPSSENTVPASASGQAQPKALPAEDDEFSSSQPSNSQPPVPPTGNNQQSSPVPQSTVQAAQAAPQVQAVAENPHAVQAAGQASQSLGARIAQMSAQKQALTQAYVNNQINKSQYDTAASQLDLNLKQQQIQKNAADAVIMQNQANQQSQMNRFKITNDAIQLQNQAAMSGGKIPNISNQQLDTGSVSDIANQMPQTGGIQLKPEEAQTLSLINGMKQSYADMQSSMKNSNGFNPTNTKYSSSLEGSQYMPEAWKGEDFKKFQNAGDNIVNSIVLQDPKRDNPATRETIRRTYIPQPGDSPAMVQHKMGMIQDTMKNLGSSLNPIIQRQQGVGFYGNQANQQQAAQAPKTATGPNGQKLILQNGVWQTQ